MKALAVVILIGAGLRAASLDIKPGLWEVTHTTQMSGMPPIDTSKMTPEQRARMEATMKAQQSEGAKTRTTKSCVTKEQLEKGPFADTGFDSASCKRTLVASSRTVQDWKVECTGEKKTTSEMRFEAVSPESMKGTIKFSSSDGKHTMSVNSTINGKWIGAACGNVK